jgi:2,3-bisphosphoglycerate-dependent phosphoglycerate mutase
MWLLRHGESTWNVLGIIQGQSDQATLTSRGRIQAQQAAQRLAAHPIGAIFASDLLRTRETAAIVARSFGLSFSVAPALRERCFGELEGAPAEMLQPEVTGIIDDRVVDPHARPAGGESLGQLYARAAGFVDELIRHEHRGDVVVVAHGGSIRAIRAYCAGRPVGDMRWEPVANGSVWRVAVGAPLDPSSDRAVNVQPSGGIR